VELYLYTPHALQNNFTPCIAWVIQLFMTNKYESASRGRGLMEGKTKKNYEILSQACRCADRDSNQAPSEYKYTVKNGFVLIS
jgi:hypothetical protein